jgi:hypothetical protein
VLEPVQSVGSLCTKCARLQTLQCEVCTDLNVGITLEWVRKFCFLTDMIKTDKVTESMNKQMMTRFAYNKSFENYYQS